MDMFKDGDSSSSDEDMFGNPTAGGPTTAGGDKKFDGGIMGFDTAKIIPLSNIDMQP
jgi:hypothetical protein